MQEPRADFEIQYTRDSNTGESRSLQIATGGVDEHYIRRTGPSCSAKAEGMRE